MSKESRNRLRMSRRRSSSSSSSWGHLANWLLVALVAEHHPIEKFQSAGLGVAAAHWVGHVVYGLVVGGIAGMYALRYDFVPVLAQIPQ